MTYRALQDFYKMRIKPEFDHGYYGTLVDVKHSMSQNQMKVRDSTILFRSSSKGSSMEGSNLDGIFLDEYDRLSPLAESSALESMKSSKYKYIRRFSTPTVPDYGIDKLYKESDKRVWMHKCPHCGKLQKLDYEKNIKQVGPDSGIDLVGKVVTPGTFQFVCQYCGQPLDRWYDGRWVTTAPGAGRKHGYLISQLDAVWVTADQLKSDEMNASSKQFFYNYTLGQPYEDKSAKFDSHDVTDNIINYSHPHTREDFVLVAAGIDWGQNYHHLVIVGLDKNNTTKLIDLYKVRRATGVDNIEKDLNLIIRRLQTYNPDIILPDLGFNGNYVDRLKQAFPTGIVYGVNVRSAATNGDPVAHFNDIAGTVTLDKLTQNLIALSMVKRGDLKFYQYQDSKIDPEILLLIQHWSNVIIRTDEDEDQTLHEVKLVKRILRKGDDHYVQALVYALAGLRKLIDDANSNNNNPLLASYVDDTIQMEPTDFQAAYNI